MIKISINDPLIALEAGEWCNTHFGEKGWELWGKNVLSDKPTYDFGFNDGQNATMFSLRWAEHS
jgi:hypothetical protein